jgi:hypothetical protein
MGFPKLPVEKGAGALNAGVKKSFSKEILRENMKMRALWSEAEKRGFLRF